MPHKLEEENQDSSLSQSEYNKVYQSAVDSAMSNTNRNPYSYRDYMNALKKMDYEKGGKAGGPKYPHDMYNTKTGEKFVAETKEDHDRMDKMGYKHLDELSDAEKQLVMEKKKEMGAGGKFEQEMEEGGKYEQKMAMGGKYEQFKRLMGID